MPCWAEVDGNTTEVMLGCNGEQGAVRNDILVDKGQEVIPPNLNG